MVLFGFNYQDYIPKSIVCLREGYTKQILIDDIFAGISVGVIALPLALAFAIASGVTPEQGLYTAIVAGFIIALLGGSRVQISGPTGAFVVVIYAIVQKHGYDGLAIATLMGGILIFIMGLAKFGVFLKFIPFPVTTGFTSGIAFVIMFSQIKDFFGLQTDKVPPQFTDKCLLFCQIAHTWNYWAFIISSSTLALIFLFRNYLPKWPGAILAVGFATIVAYFLNLPLETIESKFGAIPHSLPHPTFPEITYEKIKILFPDALTIALLGGIESLLCASVADGMTGHKHRSNCELVAQGIGNICSVLFGGIPATGAIARTAANIRLGGKTPLSGMIHATTLLLLMVFLAPLAAKIPLASLAGVLFFVAWNMSEIPHFIEILKGHRSDAAIMLITFLLTIFIDLAVAVQVGAVLAAVVFLKRMSDKTTIEASQLVVKENRDEPPIYNDDRILFRKGIPSDVVVFEINGPFFYSVADLLDEALIQMEKTPRLFILRLDKTPLIDATGINAIKRFWEKCEKKKIIFRISEVNPQEYELLMNANIPKEIIFDTLDEALGEVSSSSQNDLQK